MSLAGSQSRITGMLAGLVAVLMLVGLLIGPAELGLPAGEAARLIVWEIRMPRA